MPKDINDQNEFSEDIQSPSVGDFDYYNTVDSTIQKLTNRTFWLKNQIETALHTVSVSGGLVDFDFDNGRHQKITLTDDLVMGQIENMSEGDVLLININQDSTGGHSVTIPTSANILFESGSTPSFTTTSAAFDILEVTSFDGKLLGRVYVNWS